jgi:hypothetical protein
MLTISAQAVEVAILKSQMTIALRVQKRKCEARGRNKWLGIGGIGVSFIHHSLLSSSAPPVSAYIILRRRAANGTYLLGKRRSARRRGGCHSHPRASTDYKE